MGSIIYRIDECCFKNQFGLVLFLFLGFVLKILLVSFVIPLFFLLPLFLHLCHTLLVSRRGSHELYVTCSVTSWSRHRLLLIVHRAQLTLTSLACEDKHLCCI
ncbi:Uncharacterized protein HZ326_1751 [Fusarium oxysporum f. sp. albedinis]|nr:Uncharacterized protein HZ326_1751 [Fusarium oxysporum f. sp. albedinis]